MQQASNRYIILFAAAVCLVCSVFVAFSAVAPASRALRVLDMTDPLELAPMAIPSFMRSWDFWSSGPAARQVWPNCLKSLNTSGNFP